VFPRFERTDWLPGAALTTLLVTAGWAILVQSGSISTIWPMFGIANQLLAVVALALVTTMLINSGRARYAWVTLLPMIWVTATTMTAGSQLIWYQFPKHAMFMRILNTSLTLFVITSVTLILLIAASRWIGVLSGMVSAKSAEVDKFHGMS
jgi:carbon starvation protein